MLREIKDRCDKNRGCQEITNKGMKEIKIAEKKLKIVIKINVFKKKLNKGITKIEVVKKNLKIVTTKLRFLRKIKQRHDKNQDC